jgi:predicted transcriptional regulator
MTVVSSKEFSTNQKKYYNLAVKEKIFIKRGKNLFHLKYAIANDADVKERVYYEPDEDFYSSLSADEFREQLVVILDKIDKTYAKKCK